MMVGLVAAVLSFGGLYGLRFFWSELKTSIRNEAVLDVKAEADATARKAAEAGTRKLLEQIRSLEGERNGARLRKEMADNDLLLARTALTAAQVTQATQAVQNAPAAQNASKDQIAAIQKPTVIVTGPCGSTPASVRIMNGDKPTSPAKTRKAGLS
jgi:hypothetical protein